MTHNPDPPGLPLPHLRPGLSKDLADILSKPPSPRYTSSDDRVHSSPERAIDANAANELVKGLPVCPADPE